MVADKVENVSDACCMLGRRTASATEDRYSTSLSHTPAVKYVNKIKLKQEIKNVTLFIHLIYHGRKCENETASTKFCTNQDIFAGVWPSLHLSASLEPPAKRPFTLTGSN